MNKRLFITDIDGTLLRSDRTLDPGDEAALEALGSAGVVRAAATGRSLFSFDRLMRTLSLGRPGWTLPVDYVIFSTGAGIMDYPACSLLKAWSLEPEEVARAAARFEALGLDYMIHRPIPRTREFLFRYRGGENPDFLARIRMYREFGAPLDGIDPASFGPATEVLAVLPPDRAARVLGLIEGSLDGMNLIRATSPLDHLSTWLEVFPSTVSKSLAAAWLARRLGFSASDVMAVGNDYNDLDLLEWAGRGVVVENAPQSLRDRFGTVASNDGCGVAEAVRTWL